MGIRIVCSSCREVYTVEDALRGKRVRCRECQEPILVQPAPAGRSRNVDLDDEDDRRRPDRRIAPPPPPRAAAPRRQDDDPPRRRPRSRDDEDDRPKQGGSLLPVILIGGGVVALLFIGVVVGGVVWVVRSARARVAQNIAAVQAVDVTRTVAAAQPQQEQEAQPPKKRPEVPTGPLPDRLEADNLRRVKQATVYLRVDLPNGGIAEGTGFFAVEPGIIMTNAHVLGMLRADSLPPRKVSVVVHSGEPEEFKLDGSVLGVDRSNDLAVLRVDPVAGRLPTPLLVDSATRLIETQKVYVFGFPLGAQLGKNITVTDTSITSLRRDSSGALEQVQVNGGMHPGNSGGPVTDTRGVVVGVSVAIIRGTQISFAIPGDLVQQALDGRLSRSEVGTPYLAGSQSRLPLRLVTLDPLNRVRKVKVEVWAGSPGKPRPATAQAPVAQPGDGPRQSAEASRGDGAYVVEVPLPTLAPGQVYWMQPLLIDGTGSTQWSPAVTLSLTPDMVLDRRPVLLAFKPPANPIQRTLKMSRNVTANIYEGKKSTTMAEKTDGYVLESSKPDERGGGTGISLTMGRWQWSREMDNKKAEPPAAVTTNLTRYIAGFRVDNTNQAKGFSRPRSFGAVPAPFRDDVDTLFTMVCNTWEVTTLPIPNRMVQPMQTWKARVPTAVSVLGKRHIQDLDLDCTYEGLRNRAGRSEAFIRLSGVVKGRGARAKLDLGKVKGHALVDVDGGFLGEVKVTVSSEVELEEAGVRVMVSADSVLVRTDGNSQGITPVLSNPPGSALPTRPGMKGPRGPRMPTRPKK
jgi:S1-C subfamily serine protease